MIVGIIGLGEVGTAVKKLCEKKHQVFARTRHFDELKGRRVDILHLCYPYLKDFEKTAIAAIRELDPKLVINDSSVKPGATQIIFKKTKAPIVHAPIIGKHPDLYKYFFEMEKIIGPIDDRSYKMAKKHFNELGVKTMRFKSPLESEMAKLLSTTYYGWNILFEKYVHQLCNKFSAEFDQVYTRLNQIYNKGYARTLPHVRRPVLKHDKGTIGGHCVIPNAEILNQWLDDNFTSFVLKQNEKLGKE